MISQQLGINGTSGKFRVSRLITLALLVTLAACSPDIVYERLPQATTVLAFGDSVTHGTGAQTGEDYPSQLAALSQWQVINAGIPGDMARDAGKRLPSLLAKHQPELVIIELGGNDFLRKRSATRVKADLQKIVVQVREFGAIAVLVAVPRLSLLRASTGLLEDDPIYAQLADEEAILLIADIFSEVLSDSSLRADRIHPNARGYQQLANGISFQLRTAGLL